jgi:hypothetical protein
MSLQLRHLSYSIDGLLADDNRGAILLNAII